MSQKPITVVLKDESFIERPESRGLRDNALRIVETQEDLPTSARLTQLPGTLQDLLTQIIKPLFSNLHHPQLTDTGRKKLVNNALPTSINRFSTSSNIFGDLETKPLWQNGWTHSLLSHILSSYDEITDSTLRKRKLEAHFHLLIPPILNQLDDASITHKVNGCHSLKLLCDNLSGVSSTLLKSSGLTDVFIEALRNDFVYLPTLTPEDESLALYDALYPAYRSLVRARFGLHSALGKAAAEEEDTRQSYLTLLLRHQLLHALNHLSTGTGLGSTTSVPLSTFFIAQLGWIFDDLGLAAVIHLQVVLPILRNVLCDPFAVSGALGMLMEAVRMMQVIVRVCWIRVRDVWWGECLRGVVCCWVNIADEEDESMRDVKKRKGLREVKRELKVLAFLLEDVVGGEFREASKALVEEEGILSLLFDGQLEWKQGMLKEDRPGTKSLISEVSEV